MDDETETNFDEEPRKVKNSVMLCTGANACGKVSVCLPHRTPALNPEAQSVYLKQVRDPGKYHL